MTRWSASSWGEPRRPRQFRSRRSCARSRRIRIAGCTRAAPRCRHRGSRARTTRSGSNSPRPTFIDEAATEYQSRLDGLDRTGRRGRTRRGATSRTSGFGDYRFRVRARNVLGQVSDEAAYAFTILPPWYRTWWAYLGYAALFGLGDVLASRGCSAAACVAKERARAQFAEARLRAEAAEPLAASREARARRTVELLSDMGREITVVARLRHDLRQALRPRERARRRRTSSASACITPDRQRSSTGSPSRRASGTRRTRATRRDPEPAPGLVHRAPRAGVHQRHARPSTSKLHQHATTSTSQQLEDGSMSQRAAVDHLPAARRQGSRARHHHDPELREATPTRSIT